MAGRRRRSGDEWCGQVPPPALVSALVRSGCEGWGPARQAARVPGFTLGDLGGCAGPGTPPRDGFLREPLLPSPRRGGLPPGARGRGAGVAAPGAGSPFPPRPAPFPPRPSCPWLGARGLGLGRGDRLGGGARKEKRSWSVLQDRGDNPAQGVGGEGEASASENGKLNRGFHWPPTSSSSSSTPGLFPLSLRVNRRTEAHFNLRKMSCVPSLALKKVPQ